VAVDDYVTFTFTAPVSLAANTVYGFDVGRPGSGWHSYRNTDDSSYTGGSAYDSGGVDPNKWQGNATISTYTTDRVFHLDIVGGSDSTPPDIDTLDPDGATGVYPGANLVATFDENIALKTGGTITITDTDDGSGTQTIILLDPSQATVSGLDLVIDPASNLEFGTNYEIVIDANAVEDTATSPNAFPGTTAGQWTFTTAAQEFTAPAIAVGGKSPDDEESDVAIDTNIVATFDQNLLPGTGDIIIKDLDDDSTTQTIAVTDASQVAITGTVLTIDPAIDLGLDKNYAVQIAAGAVKNFSDLDFAGITNETDWNFTTVAPASFATFSVSTTAPTVNGADIAMLTSTDADWGSSVIWGDRPARGMTFTTGGDAGYTLNSITLQAALDQGDNGDYTIRVGTISGTTFSAVFSETTGTVTVDVAVDDYVTFTFSTPVALAANTVYGIDVGRPGSGWHSYRNTDDSSYTGGSAYDSGSGAVGDGTISTYSHDRVFHLDIATVGGGGDPYDDWATINSVTLGFDGDDDGGGTSNGAEWYYFNSNPQVAEGLGSPLTGATKSGADTFTFTHMRPLDRTGMSDPYVWSSALSTWNENGGSEGPITVNIIAVGDGGTGGDYETVTVTATVSGGTLDELFVRQELSYP